MRAPQRLRRYRNGLRVGLRVGASAGFAVRLGTEEVLGLGESGPHMK